MTFLPSLNFTTFDPVTGHTATSANSSCNVIALGFVYQKQVKIFNFDAASWPQRGTTLTQNYPGYGSVISLSRNGNYLAVGAPLSDNDAGRVYVYKWNGSNYVSHTTNGDGFLAIGNTPYIPNPPVFWNIGRFGSSLSISDDGSTLAVGVPGAIDSLFGSMGQVVIFTRLINGQWIQDGIVDYSDTYPVLTPSRFGQSVCLNSTGDLLAISFFGEFGDETYGIYSGGFSVYASAAGSWERIFKYQHPGNTENFGETLSMTADGTKIGFASDSATGIVKVFTRVGNTYIDSGNNISF